MWVALSWYVSVYILYVCLCVGVFSPFQWRHIVCVVLYFKINGIVEFNMLTWGGSNRGLGMTIIDIYLEGYLSPAQYQHFSKYKHWKYQKSCIAKTSANSVLCMNSVSIYSEKLSKSGSKDQVLSKVPKVYYSPRDQY